MSEQIIPMSDVLVLAEKRNMIRSGCPDVPILRIIFLSTNSCTAAVMYFNRLILFSWAINCSKIEPD